MTIINTTRKFIFVHVPKTAGTAVTEYFRAYAQDSDAYILNEKDAERFGLDGLNKHSSADRIADAIGQDAFEGFFKFSIVRNPFARTVSIFRFLKHNFRNWKDSTVMDGFDTVNDLVSSPLFCRPGPGQIFQPQAYWISSQRARPCMDLVGHLESLEADLGKILRRLDLPPSPTRLRVRNVSKGDGSGASDELTSGIVIDAIRTRYAEDFELFGYSSEPGVQEPLGSKSLIPA